MARYEPHVSCINIKKYLKSRNISQFGLAPNVQERERERAGFCLSELGKPRVKVTLHDESYVRVLKSQDFAKVQGSGFHRN